MNGIKSFAQDLPQYGRYNDDMVAHISSDEAKLLKSLGGAGTINPVTGLREYGLGDLNPFKAAGKVLSKFDDVVLQPITGAVQDVVQGVAKATGPLGQIAATAYGGPLGAALYGGLAGEDGFNFKRGLMSGALAYGATNLAEGIGAAGGAPAAPNPVELGLEGTNAVAGEIAKTGLSTPPTSFFDQVSSGLSNAYNAATNPATYSNMGQSIADTTRAIPENVANLGKGVSNLTSMDPAVRGAAIDAFKASGATLGNTALPIMMGTSGIAAIDEQEKMQKEQEQQLAEFNARINRGVASATEAMRLNPYNFAAGGDVNYSMDDSAVNESGLGNLRNGVHFAAGGDVSPDSIKAQLMAGKEPSMYEMRNMNVPDVIGGTGPKGYMAQTNFGKDIPLGEDAMLTLLASGKLTPEQGAKLSKYGIGALKKFKDAELSGYAEKNDETGEKRYGAKFTKRFNEGGMPPRYLSGGGDGMSDSIPATIDGKQPARLADGEFVIPADVVSHLGNGSSKAGAKRLYSMMDEVRHARTGNKKQGRQINPNKFLPK